MKKILFRGKHIHALQQNGHLDGTWVYGYLCDENYINTVDEDEYGEKFASEMLIDPESVCQYTGLTDKNGRKIFEGDIVKVLYTDGEEDGRDVTEVKYSEKSASFSPWDWEYYCDGCDLYFHIKEIEVCGNIFDNPDLMGRESVQ